LPQGAAGAQLGVMGRKRPANPREERRMMKTILAAAALSAIAFAPAFAADMMKCDNASMMKMKTQMDAMSDPAMKKMAMQEMDMAKKSMAAKKMKECSMHMEKASKDMMMK
jgi:hypothetical protein